MVCQEIKDFLAAHADARYAAFVTSLMPGARPVVGVRLPVLRALAKEITKGDWRTYLEEAVDDTFEEVMLQGYVTGAARMPFEEQMERMTAYVRKINDWALCDSPCSGFKFVRKHREEVWAFLQPYLYSGEVFSQRFAVVMLLAHFVTDDFIDRVLEACGSTSKWVLCVHGGSMGGVCLLCQISREDASVVGRRTVGRRNAEQGHTENCGFLPRGGVG
mgnify:CR=1 FL=1